MSEMRGLTSRPRPGRCETDVAVERGTILKGIGMTDWMRRLFVLLLMLAGAVPAAAQVPPYTYAITLGTVSTQILPVDPLRKRLIFHNPNATALVAVCPVGPARVTGGVTVVAAINGAGCRTILPYDAFTVDGGEPGGPQLFMPSAWVGIGSAASTALTVFEFE
jgi:hypothetical protein